MMRHTCWKTMPYPWWRILLLLCGTIVPAIAEAGTLRVVLLADVQVHGDAIFLANLLPPNTPRALNDAANKIILGSAPQNGTARRFSHDTISAALQDAGLPLTSFVVPPTVTVRHTAHSLSQLEVWPAIQSFLERHPVGALRNLRPADLTFDPSIAVSADNPRLAVTQMNFDVAVHRANFRLRLQNATNTQPFEVTAPIPSASTAHPASQKAGAPSDAPDFSSSSIALVDPRQSARLRLHSPDAEMLLAVQPLQRGQLGETIRVRLRASGKTLQARVVGQNALDAIF